MKKPLKLNLPPKLYDKLSKDKANKRLLREDYTTITGLIVEILTKHYENGKPN